MTCGETCESESNYRSKFIAWTVPLSSALTTPADLLGNHRKCGGPWQLAGSEREVLISTLEVNRVKYWWRQHTLK
ncbi:hypothetical protein J6590_055237 [Homalodisca vitripennis]|nr:hypothetical protein J6590_055237 [Homalodisca vitripennis]